MTTEIILSLSMVSVSALAVSGTLFALWTTRQQQKHVDIEATVRDAPYHRLHNLVTEDRR